MPKPTDTNMKTSTSNRKVLRVFSKCIKRHIFDIKFVVLLIYVRPISPIARNCNDMNSDAATSCIICILSRNEFGVLTFVLEILVMLKCQLTGIEEGKVLKVFNVEAKEGGVVESLWEVEAVVPVLAARPPLRTTAFCISLLIQHHDVGPVRARCALACVVLRVRVCAVPSAKCFLLRYHSLSLKSVMFVFVSALFHL